MIKENEDIMKEIENCYKSSNDKKEELLNELYLRKKRIGRKIKEHQIALNDLSLLLDETNAAICKIGGHSFDDWEEKTHKFLDRCWYYERRCSVCGEIEITEKEPNEYVFMSEKGKVLAYKKND